VTDYMMPGMSGVDLIRHVRAIQPALPAVIVTGYTEFAEFDPGRLGAVLIHKPFKREALVAQIHELVDEARRHTAPGGAAASVPL
jgi:CheY-like chemotaxis protein